MVGVCFRGNVHFPRLVLRGRRSPFRDEPALEAVKNPTEPSRVDTQKKGQHMNVAKKNYTII